VYAGRHKPTKGCWNAAIIDEGRFGRRKVGECPPTAISADGSRGGRSWQETAKPGAPQRRMAAAIRRQSRVRESDGASGIAAQQWWRRAVRKRRPALESPVMSAYGARGGARNKKKGASLADALRSVANDRFFAGEFVKAHVLREYSPEKAVEKYRAGKNTTKHLPTKSER
jgi:hypothetical protein